jgi:hypothetical protein
MRNSPPPLGPSSSPPPCDSPSSPSNHHCTPSPSHGPTKTGKSSADRVGSSL